MGDALGPGHAAGEARVTVIIAHATPRRVLLAVNTEGVRAGARACVSKLHLVQHAGIVLVGMGRLGVLQGVAEYLHAVVDLTTDQAIQLLPDALTFARMTLDDEAPGRPTIMLAGPSASRERLIVVRAQYDGVHEVSGFVGGAGRIEPLPELIDPAPQSFLALARELVGHAPPPGMGGRLVSVEMAGYPRPSITLSDAGALGD